jgi:hypothetical protein
MLEIVSDPDLAIDIRKIILLLLGPKEVETISFMFMDGVVFFGYTVFHEDLKKYFILINLKVKEMLNEKEGVEIVCAMLAHEIGHIKDDQKTGIHLKESDYFLLSKELGADKEALVFLGRIYRNPKKILLKQIEFAKDTVLKCGHATKKDKALTTFLAKKRQEALAIS